MQPKDILLNSIQMSERIIQSYLSDLEDQDLLVRPVPGMNHIAWQLGHLISAERYFVELVRPGTSPALPEDFERGHGRDKFTEDDPALFYSKARYQELWKAQRGSTLQVLDQLSDAELDRTDESFPAFAPNVGSLLNMIGLHPTMHAGQFVAVRKQLGKAVSI